MTIRKKWVNNKTAYIIIYHAHDCGEVLKFERLD